MIEFLGSSVNVKNTAVATEGDKAEKQSGRKIGKVDMSSKLGKDF